MNTYIYKTIQIILPKDESNIEIAEKQNEKNKEYQETENDIYEEKLAYNTEKYNTKVEYETYVNRIVNVLFDEGGALGGGSGGLKDFFWDAKRFQWSEYREEMKARGLFNNSDGEYDSHIEQKIANIIQKGRNWIPFSADQGEHWMGGPTTGKKQIKELLMENINQEGWLEGIVEKKNVEKKETDDQYNKVRKGGGGEINVYGAKLKIPDFELEDMSDDHKSQWNSRISKVRTWHKRLDKVLGEVDGIEKKVLTKWVQANLTDFPRGNRGEIYKEIEEFRKKYPTEYKKATQILKNMKRQMPLFE